MSRWRQGEDRDEVELAARVPDAVAVCDENGRLIGWDESLYSAYLAEHALDGQ